MDAAGHALDHLAADIVDEAAQLVGGDALRHPRLQTMNHGERVLRLDVVRRDRRDRHRHGAIGAGRARLDSGAHRRDAGTGWHRRISRRGPAGGWRNDRGRSVRGRFTEQTRLVPLGQLAGAARPAVRGFGQALLHHLLDAGRHLDLGGHERERRRLLGGVGQQHVHRRAAGERQPARQQLVEDDADAVQVAAMVHLLAAGLLRAHVARRADGELGAACRDLGELRRGVDQLGQAEIHDLEHLVGRVRIDDHQVGRLQIAMDDALGVGRLQDLAQLAEQPADAGRRRAGRCVAAA